MSQSNSQLPETTLCSPQHVETCTLFPAAGTALLPFMSVYELDRERLHVETHANQELCTAVPAIDMCHSHVVKEKRKSYAMSRDNGCTLQLNESLAAMLLADLCQHNKRYFASCDSDCCKMQSPTLGRLRLTPQKYGTVYLVAAAKKAVHAVQCLASTYICLILPGPTTCRLFNSH